MSGYRIAGLPREHFEHLFGLGEAELMACNARRVVADSKPGFPCRITLEDAEPGETLILTNFEHQDAPTPYRASHAIYVRVRADKIGSFENEVPLYLSSRLLSVRAFDDAGTMIDADVTAGDSLEPVIARMFAKPGAAYLHVHNAKRGCFAARIDRSEQ